MNLKITMNTKAKTMTRTGARWFWLGAAAAVLATSTVATADDYYKETPQFHMYPDPGAARYTLKRFGPVGIGLELRQPAFTMHITNIEEGSPAETCITCMGASQLAAAATLP